MLHTKLQIAELFEYSHSDRVAAEGVEDVGGAGEVEHELGRAGVRDALYLHASAPTAMVNHW